MTKETMTTSPSGGEKSSKLARFDLIPPAPLFALAEHFGKATKSQGGKYTDRNWEKGYAWSLCFGAMMRHAWAFWSREDIDPDSGSPHLAAVAWHAFALLEYGRTHPEYDDRSFDDPHARTREIDDRFEKMFADQEVERKKNLAIGGDLWPEKQASPDITGEDLTSKARNAVAEAASLTAAELQLKKTLQKHVELQSLTEALDLP